MIAKAEVPQLQPRERRGRHTEDVKLGLGEPKATFMRGVPRALGGSGGVVRIAQGGVEDGKHNNKRRALSLARDGLSPPRIPEPQSPKSETVERESRGAFFQRGTDSIGVLLKHVDSVGEKSEHERGTQLDCYRDQPEVMKKRKRNMQKRQSFSEDAITRHMPAIQYMFSFVHPPSTSRDCRVPMILPTNSYFQSQILPEMFMEGLHSLTLTLGNLASQTVSMASGVSTVRAPVTCASSPYVPTAPMERGSNLPGRKVSRMPHTTKSDSDSKCGLDRDIALNTAREEYHGEKLPTWIGNALSFPRKGRNTSAIMPNQAAAAAGMRAKVAANATELIFRGETALSFEPIIARDGQLLPVLTRAPEASCAHVDVVRSIHAHLMDAMNVSKGRCQTYCDGHGKCFCRQLIITQTKDC